MNKRELINWLDTFRQDYPIQEDEPVLRIARNDPDYLSKMDLETIFRWKLQPNHYVSASRQLNMYEAMSKGEIRRKTHLAKFAASDEEALDALRGLPQMKTRDSVAVASCLLMVLDHQRFTVMDRRANESLVALGNHFTKIKKVDKSLAALAANLATYNPPAGFLAVASQWPAYMGICRLISGIAELPLREIDRALYTSSGNLGY